MFFFFFFVYSEHLHLYIYIWCETASVTGILLTRRNLDKQTFDFLQILSPTL